MRRKSALARPSVRWFALISLKALTSRTNSDEFEQRIAKTLWIKSPGGCLLDSDCSRDMLESAVNALISSSLYVSMNLKIQRLARML